MSAIDLIKKYGVEVDVIRYSPRTINSQGVFEKEIDSEFKTIVSIQPLNGKELINLEEAQRLKNVVKCYSYDELRTISNDGKTSADIVIHQGARYEVNRVEKWEVPGVSLSVYYKSLLVGVN
jgi:hypothetical protein